MKHLLKFTAFILLLAVSINISCQKELSCESCGTPHGNSNKPPVANAGPDQTIVLPTDSISLDGKGSFDPDGNIILYKWTKIAGPVSFNIIKPDSAITLAKTLTMGVYKFELTVKDNGGLSAKDTIQIIVVDPTQPNRPPVANAGMDQTIILPVSTIILDGNGSTDPDNNITAYQWTKISGPSSFNIADINAAQTQVTNLVQGTYLFELKVTDAGALFSKDTIQVSVIDQPASCDNTYRPLVNAQLIPFATLSKPRVQIAVASAGTKIVFAGGRWSADCPDCWGSSRVDIYDTVTHQWSTAELSQGRWGIATVTAGNKIFFAGGEYGDGAFNNIFSAVDIYDASTNTWSVSSLSEARSYISAATVGNKVFFAGGWQEDTRFDPPTGKVDIYDLSTNTWSSATLSEARGWISGVTAGQKIYFAGGLKSGQVPSNRIDIYDAVSQSWTTSTLLTPMTSHAGITSANKIYWAADCDVEIKNVSTGNSTNANLFRPGGSWSIDDGSNAVIKDNKLVLFRPYDQTGRFDIYDITTNTWSIGVLPQNNVLYSSICVVNNTIYIAGGWQINGGPSNGQVWKLEF